MVNTSVLMVAVDAAEAPNLVLPVPLPLARAGLAFAPDDARRLEVPELAEHLPHVWRIVGALRDSPDGVLAEIEDRRDHVRVSKEDGYLRVRAREGERSTADVRLPLGSADAALRAYDVETRSFETSELVAALGTAPGGELVRVLDGEDEVTVRMW